MKHLIASLFILSAAFWLAVACTAEDDTLAVTELSIPASEINSPEVLGKILFYDSKLSINNSVSCASCHQQALAFADNKQFSIGFENRPTQRNSMPIQNLSFESDAFISIEPLLAERDFRNFSSPLFWDGRETTLSLMVLKPIVNHREMGINDLDAFVNKLQEIPYYQKGFEQVYDQPVSLELVGLSLASFLGQIRSVNTKFDQVNRGEAQLNGLEHEGRRLFFEKYDCNSCHQVEEPNGYLFAPGGGFSNIGLSRSNEDPGLGAVTGIPGDMGKFKVPSLRNVTLTAPYMHDGRFQNLEEVIDHYSVGMAANENLDFRLQEDGAPMVMDISQHEKDAIIAFLNTLTDYSMITDPALSNPFKAANR